jgi:hypothetical protein
MDDDDPFPDDTRPKRRQCNKIDVALKMMTQTQRPRRSLAGLPGDGGADDDGGGLASAALLARDNPYSSAWSSATAAALVTAKHGRRLLAPDFVDMDKTRCGRLRDRAAEAAAGGVKWTGSEKWGQYLARNC